MCYLQGTSLLLAALVLHGLISGLLFKEPRIGPPTKPPTVPEETKLMETQVTVDIVIVEELGSKLQTTSSNGGALQTWCSDWCHLVTHCPPVIGLLALNYGATVSDSAFGTFIMAHAEENGFSPLKSALLLSLVGGTDIGGRIMFGGILSVRKLASMRVLFYAIIGLTCCLCTTFVPLSSEYAYLCCLSILYGLLIGSIFAQRPTISADLVGASNIPVVFGTLVACNAGGHVTGRFVGGWQVHFSLSIYRNVNLLLAK